MRAHEHRLLTEEAAAVDGEPRARWHQHRLVAEKGDFPVGIGAVQLLLHDFVETHHADQIAGLALAAVEVNERRLGLEVRRRCDDHSTIHVDVAILLEEEEQGAANLERDIGSPFCALGRNDRNTSQIGVVESARNEEVRLLCLPLRVAFDFGEGFGLTVKARGLMHFDDLAHVFTAIGVGIACRTLHQDVNELVKDDDGDLVGFENEHVGLDGLLGHGALVLSMR